MSFDFSGIWIPLITPLHSDDEGVDHTALSQLVAQYRSSGIRGFASLSTTGEASLLNAEEQDAVLDTTLTAAQGLPVIAGLIASTFKAACERIRQLNQYDIAGIMLSSPSYIRPSQQGLVDYFSRLADISEKPLVIYEIPYRTGIRMELSSLLTLARHPNIQAIKDCAGSPTITQALIDAGNLQVLTGEDFNIFNTLCMGGHGAIAAATHIRPDLYVSMMQAIQAGQLAKARQIFASVTPLIQQLFAEPNPAPLKGLLAQQGHIANQLHFPLLPASTGLVEQLGRLAQQLDTSYPA
ncbi:4-hydroxy-tetrahydrodipicolinate synthase [Alkanindiges illinoisensis]|uniref:4-hydroxy-tetrahydrodipicolinate synthase n=1 Tax=Alkanindiges illinoisensis TaxID=197183 RepID=UPI000478E99E|nr:4-hydroxy-tetrahydrodipicolinate synthase [Alkanindiges illinoisensis]